jgi:mannobiose 2-epimerase
VSTPTLNLKAELSAELNNILEYWTKETIDKKKGGFIGQIDCNEHKNFEAEKGSVLNARILWSFSAAYSITKNEEHKRIAKEAFDYIINNFYDKEFGGIFWSINPDKTPKDTKNQIYALAFTIYGMSEYYAISKDENALEYSILLYKKIQEYSYDPINKGYFEAFTRDWQPIEDLRLSDKDANEKKTMNTHLHIVEAYANLYKVWNDETLKKDIIELLEVIETYFIDKKTGHLKLFFNENWIEKPDVISYGHDIEAAWLLLQCAESTENIALIERYKKYAILLTDATFEGIDTTDGGLWYEFDPKDNKLMAEKHWWPQAELMIGFYNAYQLTNDQKYLDVVFKNWGFVKQYIIDKKNGEWIWGIHQDYSKIEKDKAGFWKCPYHNTRVCIELIQRIKN